MAKPGAMMRTVISQLHRLLVEHTVLLLAGVFFAGVVALVLHLSHLTSRLVEAQMVQNAKIYTQTLAEFRTVYTAEVVERIRDSGIHITHDYKDHPGAIPLPATLSRMLGEQIGQFGVQVRLYSEYPFPWRIDGKPRDDFERQALEQLKRQPEDPYVRFEDIDGRSVLRYATADLMRASCVDCHNNHPDSPKHDWRVGDIRGVLEVDLPTAQSAATARTTLRSTFLVTILLASVGLAGLCLTLIRLRLDERSLRNANANLRQRNDEMEQFVYTVSHDLKNPLVSMLGYVGFLQEDAKAGQTDQVIDSATRIQNAAQRMRQTIDDLLQLIRVGRVVQEPVDVDVHQLANTIVDEMSKQIEAAHVTVEIWPEIPVVKTDPARLRQVFENLIANALAYGCSHGEPRIVIGGMIKQGQTCLFVQDNGQGIPQDYHQKVFGLFERLDPTTPGTGIGLAIVSRVMELVGGRVWVESPIQSETLGPPGQGTVFWLVFPHGSNKRDRRPDDVGHARS